MYDNNWDGCDSFATRVIIWDMNYRRLLWQFYDKAKNVRHELNLLMLFHDKAETMRHEVRLMRQFFDSVKHVMHDLRVSW